MSRPHAFGRGAENFVAPPQKRTKAFNPSLVGQDTNPKKISSERLHPSQRIRERRVFKFIFENAIFVRGTVLKVWAYRDVSSQFGTGGPKLAIIVSRKTHANATVRNLWKRRIREGFRRFQNKLDPQSLILVASQPGQKKVPDYDSMVAELKKLLLKTGNFSE